MIKTSQYLFVHLNVSPVTALRLAGKYMYSLFQIGCAIFFGTSFPGRRCIFTMNKQTCHPLVPDPGLPNHFANITF